MAYSRSSIEVTDEEANTSYSSYTASQTPMLSATHKHSKLGGYRVLQDISAIDVQSIEVEEVKYRSSATYKKEVEHFPTIGKGELSILIAFVFMVISVSVVEFMKRKQLTQYGLDVLYVARAASLFAFSGGVTNWIAVKMLFIGMPGLIGSGIIGKHFEEIRDMMKGLVMDVFFDEAHLHQYIKEREKDLQSVTRFEYVVNEIVESEGVQSIIKQRLSNLMARPEGLRLWMMGITEAKLHLWIKPVLIATALDINPLVFSTLSSLEIISASNLRNMISGALSTKIEELTCERIKTLIEEVISPHLGWLVIWGTAFGVLIGGVTETIAILIKPTR